MKPNFSFPPTRECPMRPPWHGGLRRRAVQDHAGHQSGSGDTDDIPTLIFDEIDTGISGRTAQKVSEKLCYIAKTHQVICITHLPQIAAMADTHFEIEKQARKGATTTSIRQLEDEEMVAELARLLGGAEITEAVYDNAREMKRLAGERKKSG